MKKSAHICLLLAVAVLLGMFCIPARAENEDFSVSSGCHSVDAALTVSDSGKMLETSKAVILYERNSDTMIYNFNPDQRIYPSSMVKLMTVLLAVEEGDLSARVAVTKRALSYVSIGAVSAGLIAGEELSLEDLLFCVMAASANDATTVVAEYIGGNQELFVKKMNARAKELGMTGTHYSNTHGLHDDDTYTTARDICRLLDYALDIPKYKELFCAVEHTIPPTNKSEERIVHSTNHMTSDAAMKKYLDDRVTGGKTGFTDQAGRCLAITAEGGGMELLSIVMGAEATYEADGQSLATYGSFEETDILLDYAFANFEYREIYHAGEVLNRFPVENGANHAVARPSTAAATVLPVGTPTQDLRWVYSAQNTVIYAPVEAGQVLSTVQVWYGTKCLAQADLEAVYSVASGSTIGDGRLSLNDADAGSWEILLIVLGVILGIAILIGLGVLLRKWIRRLILHANRRSRRENRRRTR